MKWRFRTNWRGKLILQVGGREPLFNGLLGEYCIKWVDATVEDLEHYYAAHGIKENT